MDQIYRLKNGQYVSDISFEKKEDIAECIPCEGETIPLSEYGHCNQCLVVEKDGKLGMMFLWSDYPITYGFDSFPFKYDRLRIYTGYCDEYAYAIAYEGGKCSVLKTTDGAGENIEVIEEDCKDNPMWKIPDDHKIGPSFSPMQFTPTRISKLGENEIFVFGSNKEGRHGGGAAAAAADLFGAQWGVGVGRTGQCYAIPTMDRSLELIAEYVEGFRCYAVCHPELTFYVTPIGCGIAGWKEEQIAPLFAFAHQMANIILPKGW